MKTEQLQKANELSEEIEKVKKMISALNKPHVNSVKAVSYIGDKENTQVYLFQTDDKLWNIILNYFKSELAGLQEEFNKL